MTGRRPDTTQVYDNAPYWRDETRASRDIQTFPQYLKENAGYTSVGMGTFLISIKGILVRQW